MHNKRFLAAGFINKLDEKLLKNRPETWSTRAHLVLYYGMLFIIALAGLCFIVPDDPRTDTGVGNWVAMVSIVALVAFIVWLIYLLRFNVFKRFGNTSATNRLNVFALYFLSVAVIVFSVYVPSMVETTRANMAYGDEEIIKDMNQVNMAVCKLEYDSLNHVWARDTLQVVDTLPGHTAPAITNDDYTTVTDTVVVDYSSSRFRKIDTAEFNNKMANGDSILRMNDSVYIFLACPQYTFITSYAQPDEHTTEKLYTSEDIYRRVILNFKPQSRTAAAADIKALINKYKTPEELYNSTYYAYDYAVPKDYYSRMRDRYSLGNLEDSFRNIVNRKYRFEGFELQIYIRLLFYITLSLSLLVFVFRHSTVKTFFLSLLTAVLLSVLTGIFMAFGPFSVAALQAWCIFYCILFFCIALTTLKPQTRNLVSGIGLNLFVLTINFLPVLAVGYYYTSLEESYRYNQQFVKIDYEQQVTHLLMAEAGGFVLLLILIPTLIHHLYRKWYAAPEE